MNEVINNILTRRSIRKFSDRKIERSDLETIIDCARYAPSGMNRQLWRFTVVQNKEMIRKLAEVVGAELGRGADYNFYAPDTIILVSNERDNSLGEADCACALQNIFLGAHSLGIGSVWINQFKGICDNENIRAVLNEVNLPENHIIWGCAALGYADGEPRQADKKTDVVEWIM